MIRAIRSRQSLLELVESRVPLKRSGSKHWGRCPFHDEKTASFKVEGEHFHCFGCGARGDVIDWVMATEHLTKGQAIKLLAGRLGLAKTTEEKPVSKPQRRVEAAHTFKQLEAQYMTCLRECRRLLRRVVRDDREMTSSVWDTIAERLHERDQLEVRFRNFFFPEQFYSFTEYIWRVIGGEVLGAYAYPLMIPDDRMFPWFVYDLVSIGHQFRRRGPPGSGQWEWS